MDNGGEQPTFTDVLFEVGDYIYSGLFNPASNRVDNNPCNSKDYIGFRIAFYIK